MSQRQNQRKGGQTDRLPVPTAGRPPADQMTDVVVVGSDPGALAAAIACRQAGWEVLVVEASGVLGGPAGAGKGQLWLPGHASLPDDDYATARDYFDRVVQRVDPATSAPRRHALLTGTADLGAWLAGLGVGLVPDRAGDHHPELPGGLAAGRVLIPQPVDVTTIGRLAEVLPRGQRAASEGLVDRLEYGARVLEGAARSRQLAHGGAGLTSALLAACQRLQVNIWWDAPVSELVLARAGGGEVERVTGVIVRRGGRSVRVFAGRAVLLAQGGFEADARARRNYLPAPSTPAWTLGVARDDGVRHLEWAAELGLQLAGLGDAWWRPGLWHPQGRVVDGQTALAAPHGFMVDATGRRFCNEAASGHDVCRAIYARARELGPQTIPTWLVVDANHRRRNRLDRRAGWAHTARTLPELAWQIKVDAAGLQATAERFDGFAERGVDDDFARGASAADRARGDRSHRPNPVLGTVRKGPFHALRVVPADLGTKGGLLTDEWARVLREDGPLPGLLAIGSAAASVTGGDDPAPGIGLAEAMVFGRRAALAISR